MSGNYRLFTLLAFVAMLMPLGALAADRDSPQPVITIKNRIFNPADLTVPANQKIKITVKNDDSEAAEFESLELNREKVVPPHDQITVYIGPLDPGTYGFFNDFDPQKSTGKIIAK